MSEILEVNQLLNSTAEPLRQFRFVLSIDGLDAFTILSSELPSGAFGETIIPFINTKRYISGQWTPNTFPIKLWQPINPSAAQKVNDWLRLNYEQATGRAGYSDFYKKEITIKLLDGPGGVAQEWTLHGAWIKEPKFGTLDYTKEDMLEIDLVIRFDTFSLRF